MVRVFTGFVVVGSIVLVAGCSSSSSDGGGAAGAAGAGGSGGGGAGAAGAGGADSGGGAGTGGGDSGGDASAQLLPVGSACTMDSDCGSAPFMCMTQHPGGYCTRLCDIANGDADCPSEAICQFDGTTGECHKKCDMATDCRSPGYDCSPASTDPNNKASHAFCDAVDMSMDGGMDGAMDGPMDSMGMD